MKERHITAIDRYRVEPGTEVRLSDWPTDGQPHYLGGKAAALTATSELNERLEELQELLYAEGKHKVLIVLQATDTGGKDGTIRHVFDGVNPQGVKVASFGVPTENELAHDYLRRVHAQTPGAGMMTIFNRSHYEDVLVVRVKNLVPQEHWRRRYDHIVAFERMLADEGTTILKFFLHISPDEQRERLEARRDTPHKRWKFSLGDLEERKRWGAYQAAFEEALTRTSTDFAPWFIVPADRKWFRNLVVSEVVVDALERLEMAWPEADSEAIAGAVVPDVVVPDGT